VNFTLPAPANVTARMIKPAYMMYTGKPLASVCGSVPVDEPVAPLVEVLVGVDGVPVPVLLPEPRTWPLLLFLGSVIGNLDVSNTS